MKVLLILSPPPPYGGGEIRSKILFDYFLGRDDYLCLNIGNKSHVKKMQGQLTWANIWHGMQSIARFCKCLISYRPEVVYVSIPKDFAPFLRTAIMISMSKMFHAEIVGDLAGRMFYFIERNSLQRFIGIFFLRRVSVIRVLGKQVQDEMEKYGLQNSYIMNNGIQVPATIKLPKSFSHAERIRFLYVGALAEYKGCGLLVSSFADIQQRFPHTELHLIGDWHSVVFQEKMENFIQQAHIKTKVHFYGLLTGEEKWKVFEKCHIYLHPTLLDGQPLAILEAMAYGLPVISTRIGAIPDTIEHGRNGFLLREISQVNLTDDICRLLSNPELMETMSFNNIIDFQQKFTADTYCYSMQVLFEQLAG